MSPHESRAILHSLARVWQGSNVAITQEPLPRALADLVQRLEEKEKISGKDFEPPLSSLRER
jgi:hypothetical protein